MTFERFIEEWAGKDWKTREWNADEIGVFQYDKLTYFLTHNTGYVWIDQLDNTFTVDTEDAVLSRFNLTNHDKYLGCALNVEFNGKYLLIGTRKIYPHPEAPEDFAIMKHLTIVVNEDRITFYMTTTSGEMVMIAKVVLEEAAIVIYNKDGAEIFRGEHDSKKFGWIGTEFSIFSHFSLTAVDNLLIRGY